MLVKLYSVLGAVSNAVAPQSGDIGYWERKALSAMGAKGFRVADYEKDSEILGQIQNIYSMEGMNKLPKVILYEQDIPNAAFIHTGTIVISTGLLKRLDKDEREGVLAHEIVHQKQNGMNLTSLGLYAAATLGATIILTNKFMKSLPEKFNGSFINYVSFGAIGMITNWFTSIPYFAHKRHQELKADEGAAWITNKPEKLASALRKLEKYPEERKNNRQKIPKTDGNLPMAASHSNAKNTHESGLQGLKKKLYSTHPDTETRVKRLEKIRLEQERLGIKGAERH